MIKEIKYTTLSTDASDYTCNDGELGAIANMVNEDGSLVPISEATELFTMPSGTKKVFVHESTSFEGEDIKRHYIFLIETESQGTTIQSLKWCTADDVSDGVITTLTEIGAGTITGEILFVETIGNVLAVNTTNGIQYVIWREDHYDYLGSRPADIIARAEVTNAFRREEYGDSRIDSSDDFDFKKYRVITDISDYMDDTFFNKPLTEEDEREKLEKLDGYVELCNIILSSINTIETKHKEKGLFAYPFLVRLAWRMYDNKSLVCHTPPILVNPCGTGRPRIYVTNTNDERKLYVMIDAISLSLKIKAPVGEWKDLISSLDVFVTPQAQGYSEDNESFVHLKKGGGTDDTVECAQALRQSKTYNGSIYGTVTNRCVIIPSRVDGKEAYDVIESESRFYLLKRIQIEELTPTPGQDYVTIEIKPTKYDFDNLTTKEVMTDSQDSRRSIVASAIYNYNSRLNLSIGSMLRSNPQAMPCLNVTTNGTSVTNVKVEVSIGGETKLIDTDYVSGSCAIDDIVWFFTDNPDAVAVWVYVGTDKYRLSLRKHETLSGKFAFHNFESLSSYMEDTVGWDSDAFPIDGTLTNEYSTNQIIQSEVNVPFFFPKSNTVGVGVGKVMALKAAVKAMSTSQFGEYPVYALATDGVWGIYVASDGRFSYMRLVTPDVCLNALTVAQIDSAVIFASARGLMMLSGSTATCISDSIRTSKSFKVTDLPSGDMFVSSANVDDNVVEYGSFLDFIKNCRVAYDYVRQRIIVFNPTKEDGERKYSYAYVYSLKGKSWGILSTNAESVINTYGNLLLTTDNGTIATGDTENITDINGLVMTRPCKLGYPDKKKTIRTIIQRGVFDLSRIDGSILYGSNDLQSWYLIASSKTHILGGITGSPYKYFRIGVIAHLNEGDSLYGCTVEFEIKQDNKLR